MSPANYENQVVVITNGDTEVARGCAALLLARGAKLVINHPPSSREHKVYSSGGSVVSTNEELRHGDKIIAAAVKSFGKVHTVLVNYSFRDLGALDNLQNKHAWEFMLNDVIKGSFRTVKAVWTHFRSNKYGRIVFADSDQANETSSFVNDACRYALFGFTQTLSREGAKYGIKVNTISPQGPYFVTGQPSTSRTANATAINSSLAAWLASEEAGDVSGSWLEVATSGAEKVRWERAKGVTLNPESNFNAAALARGWHAIDDFKQKFYTNAAMDFGKLLPQMQALPPNPKLEDPRFDGKVVIVTGGGSGLGRCYSLAFARLGASVVVNDMKDPTPVVDDIIRGGGKAIAVVASVVDGAQIIETAMEKYGHIDILVNNAGFVRDKSFANMDESLWDTVLSVHLDGAYQMTRAVWPHFVRQRRGTIINTTSTSGIYGNFGQANYSTAKLGILGLSEATAREGLKHNIRVNTIAPVASTGGLAVALSSTNDKNKAPLFKPEYIAPIVVLLSSDTLNGSANRTTGGLFEVGCGWHASTRLRPSSQIKLDSKEPSTPGTLANSQIDARNSRDVLSTIARLKGVEVAQNEYKFTDLEVILYNLAVGAKRSELQFVYEGDKDFQPIPSFGVIPFFTDTVISHHGDFLPNFKPANSLLGEIYLEIFQDKLPTSGHLSSTRRLIEVLDKGNAAVGITGYTTSDSSTGTKLFYNEVVFFARGAGGFGGPRERGSEGQASRLYTPPNRKPDEVAVYQTSEEQAALYRLTGDRMRMHIDPEFSSRGGFPVPILHGKCFMGLAARHLLLQYGPFKSIKVRFAGPVIPGQTLQTEMWKDAIEKDLVIFQVRVVETGKLCISGGSIRLRGLDATARL